MTNTANEVAAAVAQATSEPETRPDQCITREGERRRRPQTLCAPCMHASTRSSSWRMSPARRGRSSSASMRMPWATDWATTTNTGRPLRPIPTCRWASVNRPHGRHAYTSEHAHKPQVLISTSAVSGRAQIFISGALQWALWLATTFSIHLSCRLLSHPCHPQRMSYPASGSASMTNRLTMSQCYHSFWRGGPTLTSALAKLASTGAA